MVADSQKIATDKTGYILPYWRRTHAYRATAHAYLLKYPHIKNIRHQDGKIYTREQIEKALIRPCVS